MGRSVLGVVCTVLAVAASLVTGIVNVSLEISLPGTDALHVTAAAALGWFFGVGASIMLVWRWRWPLVVTGIAVAPPLLLVADSLAALIALAALATRFTGWWRWSAAALVFAATGLAVWRDASRPVESSLAEAWISTETIGAKLIGVVVTAAVYTAVPLTLGIVRYSFTERRRLAAEEAALRDQVARREEQARIAREMHDVLGHRLSLLSLQAGALEVTAATTPDAVEAAKTVRTTARQSLDDLRQVIGVLRTTGFADRASGGPAEPPQPTLADIPDLITGARQAGLAVNVTILLDQASTAPAPLATAAYRILQEALTNVLRHAPGATAEVLVRGGPGAGLSVEIFNPLPPHPVPSPGSGTGLTGVNERISLLGGALSAGPVDERTFALRAWLPWVAPAP
ncbi:MULTISPECIES: histidine kinase [unclassified Amycolatopsis]|uniref:sensor histidine kinase n=1 Tax=unclassified Amycolatopsis TaxID=2618356 RepID=UPI002874BD61|nr:MULTISPECIES: histidine kinase [unclassified Amycolatopsis]MDS0138890.1 two-component sensor histidine kinase [Amycolatopsis sp. 505]MDS0147562.1 two-component sensor histidine kinase [Amycolatopsis sp. CM201R]